VEITKKKWGVRIHCEEEKIHLEKAEILMKTYFPSASVADCLKEKGLENKNFAQKGDRF
jgi:hypothetical protein